MICQHCQHDWPEGLVQPMASNDSGSLKYTNLDPICALNVMRKHMGDNYMFGGTMALALYKKAVAYKKKMRWV